MVASLVKDSAEFQKTGILTEGEYSRIVGKLQKLLDGIRISKVRKFFKPVPVNYADYRLVLENGVVGDTDKLAITNVELVQEFSTSFFPDFESEIFNPQVETAPLRDGLIQDPEFMEGVWIVLSPEEYSSIAHLKVLLETEIRSRLLEKKPFGRDTHTEFVIGFQMKPYAEGNTSHTLRVSFSFSILE